MKMNLNVPVKDFFIQLGITLFEAKKDMYVLNDKSFKEKKLNITKSKYEGFILYHIELNQKPKKAEIVKLTREKSKKFRKSCATVSNMVTKYRSLCQKELSINKILDPAKKLEK